MTRLLPLALLAALAGCASPPPVPAAAVPDPRLCIRILYVLEDGGVFRYDELASASEHKNRCEVRTECDDTFTRYSFTLNPEDIDHWWTSL